MIEADLDHKLGLQRLPFARALGRPAAWPARRVAGEAGRRDEVLELGGQRRLLLPWDARGEADMMQQAVIVIEPEQQRADHRLSFVVAKAADHAVGAAIVLDLPHGGAVARAVFELAALGDDAVE